MDQQKNLSVTSGCGSQEEHAEVGSLVAELKAALHDAEQHITEVKMHEVDWNDLRAKTKHLFDVVEKVADKNKMPATGPSMHGKTDMGKSTR